MTRLVNSVNQDLRPAPRFARVKNTARGSRCSVAPGVAQGGKPHESHKTKVSVTWRTKPLTMRTLEARVCQRFVRQRTVHASNFLFTCKLFRHSARTSLRLPETPSELFFFLALTLDLLTCSLRSSLALLLSSSSPRLVIFFARAPIMTSMTASLSRGACASGRTHPLDAFHCSGGEVWVQSGAEQTSVESVQDAV